MAEENEEKSSNENTGSLDDSERGFLDMVRENPFIAATIILGLVVFILMFNVFIGTGGVISGNVVSEGKVTDNLNDFIMAQTGGQAEIVRVDDFNDHLYEAIIKFQGREIPLYVTKDGEYLVQGLTALSVQEEDSSSQDVPKSDKPVIELFVMTHCPYGTQAEKGLIPVIKALGDKIDAKIRFVHYFMHEPEENETPRQVCIREEQSEKYLDYLECFLEDGDSARCIIKTGIDQNKLTTCINTNADRYYEEDSQLSKGYGVRGSPTLVINGQITSSGRDSQSFLNTICSAFNESPEECGLKLSSSSPSPGFGYSTTGSSTSAQCG